MSGGVGVDRLCRARGRGRHRDGRDVRHCEGRCGAVSVSSRAWTLQGRRGVGVGGSAILHRDTSRRGDGR